MFFLNNQKGFTLIQLAVAVAVIAIVTGIALLAYKSISDQSKYEETRQKFDLLEKGIVGDISLTQKGDRTSFGYVGDMGSLPPNLDALVNATTPAWAYNPATPPCNGICNEGAGWKGPYLPGDFTGQTAYRTDGWGNAIQYSQTGGGFTLTSYGPDGTVGGNDDVVITVAQNNLYAVSGAGGNPLTIFVTNAGAPSSTAQMTVYYPTAGGVNSTLLANASGICTAGVNIPYGWISVAGIDGGVTYGPKVLVLDMAHTNFNIEINPTKSASGIIQYNNAAAPDGLNTALTPRRGGTAGVTFSGTPSSTRTYFSFYNNSSNTYTYTSFSLNVAPTPLLNNLTRVRWARATWNGTTWSWQQNGINFWSSTLGLAVPINNQPGNGTNIVATPATRIAIELRFASSSPSGSYTLTLLGTDQLGNPVTHVFTFTI